MYFITEQCLLSDLPLLLLYERSAQIWLILLRSRIYKSKRWKIKMNQSKHQLMELESEIRERWSIPSTHKAPSQLHLLPSFFTSTANFFTFTSAPSFSRAASRFFMGLLLAELGPRVAGERERRLGPSSNPLRGRGLGSTFRGLCVGVWLVIWSLSD